MPPDPPTQTVEDVKLKSFMDFDLNIDEVIPNLDPLASIQTDDELKRNRSQSSVVKHHTEKKHDFENFLPPRYDVRLSMKNVFDILQKALEGNFEEHIPTRESASPICSNETCFYVCGKGTLSKSKKRRYDGMNSGTSISVKYQSFNEKNCQVWWSPEHDYLLGVVCRSMSKVSRPKKGGANPSENRNHGYGGRYYQLIKRPESDEEFARSCKSAIRIKSWVVDNVPGLVQFWKLDTTVACDKTEEQSVISSGSSTTFHSGEISDYVAQNIVRGDLHVAGDLTVDGETIVRNLHVKGNLLVEGCISGQLVTPPGAADYAEWFAYLDPNEKILPGMVVQLRPPEQKITLDTSGHGPHLIVSTTPSVAAGVPPASSGREPIPGALCAFLGQVPVNVIGPVRCGQYLFPSNKNDGYAIAHGFNKLGDDNENEPLGTAMVSCGPGKHTILSFIRWQHNLKYQILKRDKGEFEKGVVNIWVYGWLCVLEKICELAYIFDRPQLIVQRYLFVFSMVIFMYATTQFPKYTKYVVRGDIFIFCGISLLRIAFSFMQLLSMLRSTQSDYVVADALMPLITILAEAVWISKSFELANSKLWQDMDYRKISLPWIVFDSLRASIIGLILQYDTKAECECPVENIIVKKKVVLYIPPHDRIIIQGICRDVLREWMSVSLSV